jgi:choice-of-anchor C domain-containing protein
MSEACGMPTAIPLMLRVCVLALLAAILLPASARAYLVVNGSFEQGPPLPTGRMTLSSGSAAITGWTVSAGSVDLVNQVHWQPAHLARSLGLNGSEPGAVAQAIPTIAGEVYDVSFWISGEPSTVPLVKNLRVSAAGQSADFSFDSEHIWEWSMGWEQKVWSFTASGPSTELEFRSLDAGTGSPAIDQIAVTGPVVSVGERVAELRLAVPRPNPARGRVTIECSLPRAGRASIAVLDLQGRQIASLAGGDLAAGPHTFSWNGAVDDRGAGPGLYFIRLTADGTTLLRRVALIR